MRMFQGWSPPDRLTAPSLYPQSVSVFPLHHPVEVCTSPVRNAVTIVMLRCDRWHSSRYNFPAEPFYSEQNARLFDACHTIPQAKHRRIAQARNLRTQAGIHPNQFAGPRRGALLKIILLDADVSDGPNDPKIVLNHETCYKRTVPRGSAFGPRLA
jgi:hypothetical protein